MNYPSSLSKILETQEIQYQERILQIRQRIISFDSRMGEKSNSTKTTVTYGQTKENNNLYEGEKKLCASFHLKKSNDLEFILYLPFPKKSVPKGIMKMKIVTENWQTVSKIYPPSQYVYPWSKPNEKFIELNTYMQVYKGITGKNKNAVVLDDLIEIALEEWVERIST